MSRYHTLWGVYHADGGFLGELAYVLGKLRGTTHCALCDITHGKLAKKPAFEELERELPIPIRLLHLNERPAALIALTDGSTPCVVGESEQGFDLLIGSDALRECHGSIDRFREALSRCL